jgi:hypothetical protein
MEIWVGEKNRQKFSVAALGENPHRENNIFGRCYTRATEMIF